MERPLISVEDAAARLGVNPQRVRALIAADRLPAQRIGRSYALDPSVVATFARRPRPPGRPLSARSAWALLGILSARADRDYLPRRARDRVQSLVDEGADAVAKALLHAQPRAKVHVWRVLPVDLQQLDADPRLVKSGLAADRRVINIRYDASRDGLDAYLAAEDVDELQRRLRPIEESGVPNLVLRSPLESSWILAERVAPPAVAAADLLGHSDPRVDRAARQALQRILDVD
jgi:excisionase family DNA binding protein